jgi:hypothetical protein
VCMYTSVYVMCALHAPLLVMEAAEVSDVLDRYWRVCVMYAFHVECMLLCQTMDAAEVSDMLEALMCVCIRKFMSCMYALHAPLPVMNAAEVSDMLDNY